jgi:hypothetical protein
MLFDVRHGGKIYSMTNSIGMESGILAISLPGRETGIGKGVLQNTDGHTAQTPLLLLLKTGITIMPFVETILKPIHLMLLM